MAIYLDNNATTPLIPEVQKAITDFLSLYGNPGSMHSVGREVKAELETARQNIADFFHCKASELTFTSCASEANNMVLKSILFQKWDFTPHLIISAIEHPCILNTAEFLEKQGVEVTRVGVSSEGIVAVDDVEKAIKDETVLVAIMHANNEVGTIQPIEEIGKVCRQKGVWFHSDMVQSPGKIEFKLDELPVDSASFSAHKMHALKGIGVLYTNSESKSALKLTPLIHGGHQEEGKRAGTENSIGIVSFGTAAKALRKSVKEHIAYVKNLRDTFEEKVIATISDIHINGKNAPRKPCTSNISFKYIEGESILLRLDMQDICVSTGSACSTGSLDPSHVIMALHGEAETAHGSIRFSFSHLNTMDDVDKTVEALKETITFLRSISPLVPKK